MQKYLSEHGFFPAMYNLRTGGGSFKGIIGEYMFKLPNKNVVLTRFFNKPKYFSIFGKYFTPKQLSFLQENWYSIDAIDIVFNNGAKEVILYEIKTRNKYYSNLPFKPKMTLETHHLYHQAKQLQFITKIATIWLYDNWDYDIEISDFDERYYCVDRPKPYDKNKVAAIDTSSSEGQSN